MSTSSGSFPVEERNYLLQQMTGQVEELVLTDNYDQNQAITIAQRTPVLNIENFGQLIRNLEK